MEEMKIDIKALDKVNAKIEETEVHLKNIAEQQDDIEKSIVEGLPLETSPKRRDSIVSSNEEWKELQNETLKLRDKLFDLEMAKERILNSPSNQVDTIAYEKANEQLSNAKDKLILHKKKLEEVDQKYNNVSQSIRQVGTEAKRSFDKSTTAVKKASKSVSHFSTRLKGIVASAFVFNIISAGLRKLTSYMGSAIKTNNKFASNLAKIKGNLLTAFQPIYQAILPAIATLMSGLSKITAYIAKFTAVLFGTTVKSSAASAEALYNQVDALDDVADSAKNAKKQLGAIDELNLANNSEDSSSTGSSSTSNNENISADFGAVEDVELPKWLEGLAQAIHDIASNKTAVSIIEGLTAAILAYKVGSAAYKALTGLVDGLTSLSTFGKIAVSVVVALAAFEIGQDIYNWWFDDDMDLNIGEWFAAIIDSIVTGEIWDALDLMWVDLQNWTLEVVDGIGYILTELLVGIWDWICEAFGYAWDFLVQCFTDWGKLIANIFTGIWDCIVAIFSSVTSFFGGIFKAAWEGIKAIWSGVGNFFKNIWSGIKSAFSSVGSFFINAFKGAWNGIKSIWSGVGSFFKGIWSGIKAAFGSVTSWFKNIFSSAWQAVKNVFCSGGKIFEGIKSGIANVFKSVVNTLIKGINTVIAIPFKAINGFLNKIRSIDILGFTPFDFIKKDLLDIPQIPYLATGTVVPANYGEFLAVLGDNKKETEVVSPLSTIKQAVREVAEENGTEVNVKVYLEGDAKGVFRLVKVENDKEKKRTGKGL